MKSLKDILNESLWSSYIEKTKDTEDVIHDIENGVQYNFMSGQRVDLIKEPYIDQEYHWKGSEMPLRFVFKSAFGVTYDKVKFGTVYTLYFLYDYHNNISDVSFLYDSYYSDIPSLIKTIGYDRAAKNIADTILSSKEWKNMNMPNTFPKSFEKQFKDIKKYWEKNLEKDLAKDLKEQFD